jgi:hypothetical protein
MTENLTQDELETLHKGVTGAGLLVSLSDRRFFDTFKEAGALGKHVAQARQSGSGVVQQVAGMGGTGFGLTAQPDQIERDTMDALHSAVSILQSKAPDELEAYRSFVLEVAQSVSDAAGGGEAAEGQAIEKIRGALAAA